MDFVEHFPDALAERVNKAIEQAESEKIAERILAKDASVWTADHSVAKMIGNSLGWVTVAGEMLGVVDELRAFADEVRGKFRHVMVCGMGGSSFSRGTVTASATGRTGICENGDTGRSGHPGHHQRVE